MKKPKLVFSFNSDKKVSFRYSLKCIKLTNYNGYEFNPSIVLKKI